MSGIKQIESLAVNKNNPMTAPKKYLVMLMGLALAGCQDRSRRALTVTPPPSIPATEKPAEKFSGITEFKTTIVAGALPNQYSVQLSWKLDGEPKVSISRVQRIGELNVKVAHDYQGQEREAIDNSVEPGIQYEYQIVQSATGKTLSQRVLVPRDFEVLGEIYNPSITGYRRLFLKKGAKISTEGQSLNIKVEELISEGSTIVSFFKNTNPGNALVGRSGGRIEIVADSARGTLQLIGNGQNGGNGARGIDGVNGKAGTKGQSGSWGMNPELYTPRANISANLLESIRVTMERDNPPPESSRWNDSIANMRQFTCAVAPGEGAPGENGSDGRDGAMGGRGGDSAEIFVNIKNDAGLYISTEAGPGLGGLGGGGGRAGKGGMGGEAGDLDRGHLCNASKQGPAGSTGRDGLQGRVGENGIRKPMCISIANREEGDCHGK